MLRTVPNTGNDEINLYIRTIYSLLRSSDAIKIEALEESHKGISSSLHIHARDLQIDISALVYTTLRLPAVIRQTRIVVLGQSSADFRRAGFGNVETWQRVYAPARRRRTHYDGAGMMAVMIASRSDIDDIIPILVALQIEWNKIHSRLQIYPPVRQMIIDAHNSGIINAAEIETLAITLDLTVEDIERLRAAWKEHFLDYLKSLAERQLDLALYLLASSQMNYRKAVGNWWQNLSRACEECDYELQQRPVYFVSSNTHAIPNLLSGYTVQIKDEMQTYLHLPEQGALLKEWQGLKSTPEILNRQNFFYYLLKKYQSTYPQATQDMFAAERRIGLLRIPAEHGFDIEAQVLTLHSLDSQQLDARVRDGLEIELLRHSDALILNIDYPLGMAAFDILTRISEGTDRILGIYVMGKAATFNGRIGDVMLVNVIHDEHSENTYMFDNCFRARQITPYLCYGMLLDFQKAVTTRGTFLQNRTYIDVFYEEGYTVLEMEAGPYLSAVYEMVRPRRHPHNEIVNLYGTRFDLGFIHYASDTPFSRGHNLGAGSLGYQGIDSTYATSIAILRRIFEVEIQRIKSEKPILAMEKM